jgi:dihydroorotate dehydrogenase
MFQASSHELSDFQRKGYYYLEMLYSILKPLLFSLPPERAHELTLSVARLGPFLGKLSGTLPDKRLSLKVGSHHWKSPIGLAAGLDKNAEALDFFSHQGFGSLECGTITLRPQLGNPRPRLFRYPSEESLRNAMGFPNEGLLHIAPRLESFARSLPLGANIGKNKDSTPLESIEELSVMMATLEDDVDYFVINVSSPNTPGLRALQEKSYLTDLFKELKATSKKDLYLKIAPDLEENKVIELTELAAEYKLTGLIATNTTIMPEKGIGGVSGVLLREKARKIRKLILDQNSSLELIGVGGMTHFQDILDFWKDGGKAIQLYTAYVYQGPDLLSEMNKALLKFLNKNNLKDLNTFFELDLKTRRELLN